MRVWSEDELTSEGVAFADEGLHPHAPKDTAWNESVFFDWIDESGALAGHCRIGRHPGLDRLWIWVYLYADGRWVGLSRPELPLTEMTSDGWEYQSDSISVSWQVERPLAESRLSIRGIAHTLQGEEAQVPFDVTLTYRAAGPAHGMAARKVKGGDGETYLAGRYEQPCDVTGTMVLGEERWPITGRGERDHSWGPRHWAMQWLFLVLEGASLRAQCTEVLIGGAMRISVGYVLGEEMHAVKDTRFELEFAEDAQIHKPFVGSVSVSHEGGELAGRLVCLSGVALDDGHCLPEGIQSIYRRTLIRFEPEGGGEPVMGWMETHRLVSP